jgi:hypothetical protein
LRPAEPIPRASQKLSEISGSIAVRLSEQHVIVGRVIGVDSL